MTTTIKSSSDGSYGALQVNGVDSVTFDSAGILTGYKDVSITPEKLTQKLTQVASVTAAGTAIDFTGIPSWVKRITLELVGVSTIGTSPIALRLGTAGGFITTGYTASAVQTTTASTTILDGTTLIPLTVSWAATVLGVGHVVLTNITGNIWLASGVFTTATRSVLVAGYIDLGAVLTQLRVTTIGGSETFDAGSISMLYEG